MSKSKMMRKEETSSNKRKAFCCLMWITLLVPLTGAEPDVESLTPYGQAEKDDVVQVEKLSSMNPFVVHLNAQFTFTGNTYDEVYLLKNGVITLDGVHSGNQQESLNPQPLPLPTAYPLIAPFWTDGQMTLQGKVWFQQTMNMTKLDIIKHKIQRLYSDDKDITVKWALVVTWENLTFVTDLKKFINTFQLVLAITEDSSFILFQYRNLTLDSWQIADDETDKNRTQSAVAGYNGGDGSSYTMLPGSTSKDILKIQSESNVNVSGLWVFRCDQSQKPCVQKGLAVMLLFVILLSILAGIIVGLLIAWCFWNWKHKTNDYENLDSVTSDPKGRKSSGSKESPEKQYILPKETTSVSLAPMYTSHAEVDPRNEPEEIPRRKITVIKKH